jgi:hypothetical protein
MPNTEPRWKSPEKCRDCGFSDFRWIAGHEEWACNVCGAAQFKPKTPEEIKARQQRDARSELTRVLAQWGLAFNKDWNPKELNDVCVDVEKFLSHWETGQ